MGHTGKVWLVGAGPGSSDLLTVKARNLLKTGDCIIYDRLVGKEILSLIPWDKEMIDVGKSAGRHIIPQSEINKILIREARLGKKVIRLKGGDPLLFGRGGEEMEMLCEEGIPFEVVPGVSSSFAVPAYNGIPITHRSHVSGVHIIAGHRRDGQSPGIDYEALVQAEGTLLFLMGVGTLEEIMNGLMLAGMDRNMPAAVLQQGTMAGQRRIAATVGTLAREAREQEIKAPSVIVVGEVCLFADQFEWYEKLPLSGQKIIVTRPLESGFKLQDRLKELGAEVYTVPVIRMVPIEDSVRVRMIERELARLNEYQVLVFTSAYGVDRFFEILLAAKMDARNVSHMRFAVIGQGTAAALRTRGLRADHMPGQYDGASLGTLLAENLEDGTRILIARSSAGAKEILEEIRKNPALSYTDLSIYDTIFTENQEERMRLFMEDESVIKVIFTSSSTVEGFCRLAGDLPRHRLKAICIGRKTAQAAGEAGMQTVTARNATVEELVRLVQFKDG